MDNSELNRFILHYLTKDKTQRAIMLTSAWGSGKSYYVKNTLKPFLEDRNNGKHKCVIVSLYGLSDTSEISKAIYMELRTIKRSPSSETANTAKTVGKIVGRTIFNGLVSKIGFDIGGISDNDLQDVYESIDLTDKLIVLEDIERTQIDIIELLGYVNNMCENDGVKVLLVTNENEILHYDSSEPDKDGKTHKIPNEKTVLYLKSKEKTVGDTIVFHGDLHNAVQTIMLSFNNPWLSSMASDETINDVVEFMYLKSTNLRTLIYAFQKISDIFDEIEIHEDDLLKTVLFSVINFAFSIENEVFPEWEGTDLVSSTLGYFHYPLYRFCYDYIRWHEFDKTKVSKAVEAHKKLILYNRRCKTNGDNDLNVIFDYSIHDEKEVRTALNNIESRLSDTMSIPFYCYGKLAYYLVECHFILDFDYTSCKDKMINNLCNRDEDIDPDFMLLNHFEFDREEKKKAFDEFQNAIKTVIQKPVNLYAFTYSPEDISEFNTYVAKNNDVVTRGHSFISKFDFDKLLDVIFVCNPSQLQDLRLAFLAVYRHAKKGDFVVADVVFMKNLSSKLKEYLSHLSDEDDKIIILQLHYLIDNLERFIQQLS